MSKLIDLMNKKQQLEMELDKNKDLKEELEKEFAKGLTKNSVLHEKLTIELNQIKDEIEHVKYSNS